VRSRRELNDTKIADTTQFRMPESSTRSIAAATKASNEPDDVIQMVCSTSNSEYN